MKFRLPHDIAVVERREADTMSVLDQTPAAKEFA
jgi:hypothetical protein